LFREGCFKNSLENLFVAKLQSLLEGLLRIKGRKACVFVPAAGQIPQRSDVRQPGK